MGCVAVFAPQKGATEHMMKDLAAGMDHVARVVEQQLGISVANITSGGAAGGLGAAAVAFMGATLTPGARCFIRETGLHALVDGTTWLITGEGCLDSQSLQGKVVSGIIETAQAAGARVAVIAGQVRLAQDQYRAAGITHALPIMQPGMSLQEALTHTPELLHTTAARLALLFAGSHTTARSCRKGLGTASAT
jgi:glycerate kinase